MATNKCYIKIFLASSCLCASVAWADVMNINCKWYFKGEIKKIYAFEKMFIDIPEADAVQICEYQENKINIYISSGIKSKNHVLYYLRHGVVSGNNLDIYKIKEIPNNFDHLYTDDLFVCVNEKQCDNEADDGFIDIAGMTIGGFFIYKKWLFSIADSEPAFKNHYRPMEKNNKLEDDEYNKFLDMFYRSKLPIRYSSIYFSKRGFGKDSLYAAYILIGDYTWKIFFDIVGEEIVVESVSEVI